MNPIADFLKVKLDTGNPKFDRIETKTLDGYSRSLIEYSAADGDRISAFLFEPTTAESQTRPAVLIHHQHNGEQHLGKSEVAGLKGNSYQAFAPSLVKRGFVVLAPDQICFEDRRRNKRGTEPSEGDGDFLQQFNEMTYRLVKGDTLMRKVLSDASVGISLLSHHSLVDQKRIGVMGHSLGGNTTLFQAAIDERIKFACSSGALCSYKNKMENETSFEMGLAIPGFLQKFEMRHVIQSILPRDLMVISGEQDKYSKDAGAILDEFKMVKHFQFPGVHELDEQRFKTIIEWIATH